LTAFTPGGSVAGSRPVWPFFDYFNRSDRLGRPNNIRNASILQCFKQL